MKKAENRVLTFLLSEEHRSIPLSELLSILASEKVSYKLLSNKGPLVRIEISGNLKEICDRISYRASMLKLIIKELVYLRTFDLSNLRKILLKRDLSFLQNKSFYVRIIKKGECDVRHSSTEIESAIGSYIIQSVSKAKVNFESPDFILVGVLYDNTLSLGVLLKSVKRGTFLSRSPRKRPFFMSSALDVYTSRVMVNLAKAGSDSLIFDPFAGTGGILIEAGILGYDILGSDIKERIVRGCLENLAIYSNKENIIGILQSDALKLPLRNNCVDAIVTDPPYGRSSTTMGRGVSYIYTHFIPEAKRVLKKGGRLVILYPKKSENNIKKILEQEFMIEEKHLIRVHKNLIRVLVVARKEA